MPKFYTIMFAASMALVITAIFFFASYGLNYGVDFKGGSLLDLNFSKGRPAIDQIQNSLPSFAKDANISPSGDKEAIIKLGELSEDKHQQLLKTFVDAFPNAGVQEVRFDSVGPAIGNELKSKSIKAIIYVLLAITIYIVIVFRKLARTFSPWIMSFATMAALAHDVILPLGFFAWLGHSYQVEVSAVFVAAILTILGYSISDTVIVFDRVRENIIRSSVKGETFGQLVHRSIMQTLARSINTSLTVILSLVAIYFFGGANVKYFALALIVGIVSGAYSSIFVASPLLVWLQRRSHK